MKKIDIARFCHQSNKAYCEAIGDYTQVDWDDAEDWQKDSALAGVNMILEDPDTSVSSTHDSWLADKVSNGWTYGPIKDPVNKTHPCIVPFSHLPIEQQLKDKLFSSNVELMRELV